MQAPDAAKDLAGLALTDREDHGGRARMGQGVPEGVDRHSPRHSQLTGLQDDQTTAIAHLLKQALLVRPQNRPLGSLGGVQHQQPRHYLWGHERRVP